MAFKSDFRHEPTLTISEYNGLIRKAFNRIKVYRKARINTYFFVMREVEFIRHCKVMIRLIQSQLN